MHGATQFTRDRRLYAHLLSVQFLHPTDRCVQASRCHDAPEWNETEPKKHIFQSELFITTQALISTLATLPSPPDWPPVECSHLSQMRTRQGRRVTLANLFQYGTDEECRFQNLNKEH